MLSFASPQMHALLQIGFEGGFQVIEGPFIACFAQPNLGFQLVNPNSSKVVEFIASRQ